MVVSKGRRLRCYLCKSFADKNKKIILHGFPKPSANIKHFKKWLYVLDLNERDEVKNLKICSKHFKIGDYLTPTKGRLKACAVPSLKVPNSLAGFYREETAARKVVSVNAQSNGSIHQDITCSKTCDNADENNANHPTKVEEITLKAEGCSSEQITENAFEECNTDDLEMTSEREPSVELAKETDVETKSNQLCKTNNFLLERGVRLLNALLSTVSSTSNPVAEVFKSRKKCKSSPILTAYLEGVRENIPFPMEEEEECSSIPEMDEWTERDEEKHPCEYVASNRCPMTEHLSSLEDYEPRPLSSHSFTVPRYLLDLMISKLRRTRLKLRTAEASLQVQTMQTESLHKTNEKLLEKITDLRRKVFQLELQKSYRGHEEGDQRVLVNIADNTSYNLIKAEKDFLALRERGLMPRSWSFITTSAGLLLLFVNNNHDGPSSWPVGKSVLLQPDMTLSIRLFDRPMPNMKFGQMKDTMDVLSALDKIASIRPCLGVCGNCLGEGFVPNEARCTDRCQTCRKERKRLRTGLRRKQRAVMVKAEKRKMKDLELKNLRKKLKRLQDKAVKEKETTRLRQGNRLPTQQISSTSDMENMEKEVVVTSST